MLFFLLLFFITINAMETNSSRNKLPDLLNNGATAPSLSQIPLIGSQRTNVVSNKKNVTKSNEPSKKKIHESGHKTCQLTEDIKKKFLESYKKQYVMLAKWHQGRAKVIYRNKNDILNEALAYATAAFYFSKAFECCAELKCSAVAPVADAKLNEDKFSEVFETFSTAKLMTEPNESDLYRAQKWRCIVLGFASNNSNSQTSNDQLVYNDAKFYSIEELNESNIPADIKLKFFFDRESYKIDFDDRLRNIYVFHGKHTNNIGNFCDNKKNSTTACFM